MQRRAAAVYIVFFVVVAIGAYSLITVAEAPTPSVEGQAYAQGDNLTTPGGEAWTVNISEGSGEVSRVNESVRFTASFANDTNLTRRNGTYRPASNGSSSGGGGATTSSNASGGGTTASSNASGGGATTSSNASSSATTTAGAANTTAAGSTNASGGTRFSVVIANGSAGNATDANASGGNASDANGSDSNTSGANASGGNASDANGSDSNTSGANASGGNASDANASGGNASGANLTSFTLRETFDVDRRLQADPAVADTTLTGDNGTEFVRYRNGTTRPLDAYLPTPTTRNVSVGDTFPYRNNTTTVVGVNTTGVSLAWEGPRTESQELEEGTNLTLGNTTYVPQFGADNSTVTLSRDVAGYQEELADVSEFNERILGLWGVAIISVFAAILIGALAYLPVRG